jgi:hypothetical protein
MLEVNIVYAWGEYSINTKRPYREVWRAVKTKGFTGILALFYPQILLKRRIFLTSVSSVSSVAKIILIREKGTIKNATSR